jgi:hypothetical protein
LGLLVTGSAFLALIPGKAGIQLHPPVVGLALDPRLRGDERDVMNVNLVLSNENKF